MVVIKLPVKKELNRLIDREISKIKFEKYNIPYEKNMFSITIPTISFKRSESKSCEKSLLSEKMSSLSLKIK